MQAFTYAIGPRQSAIVPQSCYFDYSNPMIRSYKGITPEFPTTSYVDESAQLLVLVCVRVMYRAPNR